MGELWSCTQVSQLCLFRVASHFQLEVGSASSQAEGKGPRQESQKGTLKQLFPEAGAEGFTGVVQLIEARLAGRG